MKSQRKTIMIGMNQTLYSLMNRLKITAVFTVFMLILLLPKNGLGATGEETFTKLCSACHSLSDNVVLGPGLKGLSERRSEEWLIKWIKDSKALIESGDTDATALFDEYKNMPMPGFPQLSDDEITGLLDYIKTNGEVLAETSNTASTAANATPASNQSNSKDNQYLFWISVIVVLLAYIVYRFKKTTAEGWKQAGFHADPHSIPNYFIAFAKYLIIAGILIYILIKLLENNIGMTNTLLFIALPYLSFGVFIIGSIYRYKKRGFQVSSLSSQFLEGKKLFWGSLPFHWGLVVIFTGHLIAFLFPSTVLAWNGQPIRLLILEVASFAFGLSILLGLILLIKRRFASKMILVVTNKMDIVVYTILLVQVLSGLGVAFYVRWGSSWFASVLTPYLRSIFSFRPDINSVSEMPWLIQIHIVSAFVIIGIIPFTRFMHFLVAPFDYAWRKYQLVVWNWNPRKIRTSTNHNFGKKPRNH